MNSRNGSKDARHKCDIIQAQIKELRGLNIPWSQISAMYCHIPKGSLQMWVDGKRDLADEHKIKLGIPVKIPTVPCSACGKVHAYDRACEKQVIIKNKPKPKEYKRWGWLWDMPEEDLLWKLENRE